MALQFALSVTCIGKNLTPDPDGYRDSAFFLFVKSTNKNLIYKQSP